MEERRWRGGEAGGGLLIKGVLTSTWWESCSLLLSRAAPLIPVTANQGRVCSTLPLHWHCHWHCHWQNWQHWQHWQHWQPLEKAGLRKTHRDQPEDTSRQDEVEMYVYVSVFVVIVTVQCRPTYWYICLHCTCLTLIGCTVKLSVCL